jgi:hypothetical protein
LFIISHPTQHNKYIILSSHHNYYFLHPPLNYY